MGVQAFLPDMTFLGTETPDDNLNRMQALHESAVHEQMTESRYEEQIVRIYGTWAVLWLTNTAVRRIGGKAWAGLGLPKSPRAAVPSRFEKPIAAATAEKLFLDNGFIKERLRYWTNLRLPVDPT